MRIYRSEIEEGRWFRAIAQWRPNDKQLDYIVCLKEDRVVLGFIQDIFPLTGISNYEWKDRPQLALFTSMSILDFEELVRTNRFLFSMNDRWCVTYVVPAHQAEYDALYENHVFQESASVAH